ncbi:polysaccharide pyruvyl transferase family protein [Rhizobium glycinendophyticum]|uniref:Polysaccharide pyruvyl transferase domain-containing protein n=1 Tax=Rhizobium glycinendophyticum TaxID=2589807 RepID=A0A504UEJ4_9HYPH|nr:polysaccharide pyruvyl transferase family protein [Rhizobium glycinendophyticum]TPP03922.1 hypothetical protein FJQ55_22795 [Rhizobium glycinendophyticum]
MSISDTSMDRAKENLALLANAIPRGSKVVYVDPPIHLNVGDLLINLGVEKLFHDYSIDVALRISLNEFDRTKRFVTQDHVIVLHGGGNMGDVWPGHEAVRLKAVNEFKKCKILLFPQSIHFRSEETAKRHAAVYRQHPDLSIFVRDLESQKYAADVMGLDTKLAPDTAHQLWNTSLMRVTGNGAGTLEFMRRDREASASTDFGGVDWDDIKTVSDKLGMYSLRQLLRLSPNPTVSQAIFSLWYSRRDSIVRRSIQYFDKFETIKTSRLHGAILGALLKKKVLIQDNNYGKVGRYCSLWFGDQVKTF